MLRAGQIALLFLELTLVGCAAGPRSASSPNTPPAHSPALTPKPTKAALSPVFANDGPPALPAPKELTRATATSPGPLSFEAAAPDGRWLVLCQAREDSDGDGRLAVEVSGTGELRGDTLRRYLELASGETLHIDDLLAVSGDGRWLVLNVAGRIELYDSARSESLDLSALGADGRRDPAERSGHRVFTFTPSALLYVREREQMFELIEHALAGQGERVLYRSRAPIARLTLDPSKTLLTLQLARDEDARNGRFVWPRALESGPKPCSGPLPRFVAAAPGADAFAKVVIRLTDGSALLAQDLVTAYRNTLVRRDAEGRLLLERPWGERQPTVRSLLADRSCAGRLLWADGERDAFLLGCALPKKPGRLGVELVAAGKHTPFDFDVAQLAQDAEPRALPRLVALYPGADVVLFDSESHELHPLVAGDSVLSTWHAHALIRRGKALYVYDAEKRTLSGLPGTLSALGDLHVQGPLAFVSPLLVDLEQGRVLGTLSGKVYALTMGGALLCPQEPPTADTLAQGPLSWRVPE